MMRWRSRRSRGFTLVELMVVVAIVAVLAILGMVGYRRIVTSSHSAEARHMLGAIRLAQESRRAETGSYSTPSPAYAPLCPTNGLGDKKTAWNPACGTWAQLPVQTDGPVRYAYASVSGGAGATVPAAPGQAAAFPSLTWPAPPDREWFVAYAELDENSDGTFSRALTSSFSNEVWMANEGD